MNGQAKELLRSMVHELKDRRDRDGGSYTDGVAACVELVRNGPPEMAPADRAWIMCSAFQAVTVGMDPEEVHPFSTSGWALMEFMSMTNYSAFCDVFGEEDFEVPEWADDMKATA